jgi:hypothetical protein
MLENCLSCSAGGRGNQDSARFCWPRAFARATLEVKLRPRSKMVGSGSKKVLPKTCVEGSRMGVIEVEFERDLAILGVDGCEECCQTSDLAKDGLGEAYGCREKNTVLTHREEEVLKQIREISLEAKSIKEQMKRIDAAGAADEAARSRLGEELASLRQHRSQLESERIAAAEERMRLLGHA